MKFRDLADSQIYFEISKHALHVSRLDIIKAFFLIMVALPFAIFYKLGVTFLKIAFVISSGLFLTATLGLAKGLRELFIKRVSCFATNLADWILYPFAILTCISRFLLAILIHPSLF